MSVKESVDLIQTSLDMYTAISKKLVLQKHKTLKLCACGVYTNKVFNGPITLESICFISTVVTMYFKVLGFVFVFVYLF